MNEPLIARRRLGRTGLAVSEIGFGAWGIGGSSWGGTDDVRSQTALAKAFERGLNFVDTALIYGKGHSEQLVARSLGNRSGVCVATKIPPKNMTWPARPGIRIKDVYPLGHIKKCTEESLRNLRRDVLDLQQFHVWNHEWTGENEWREAVDWLKRTGKARFVGISGNDHLPATVIPAIKTGMIDCVQVIYNIFDPSPVDELFPLCRQMDIGVIARVPFDEGSLAGAVTPETTFPAGDMRARYFAGDRKRATWERVEAIRKDVGGTEPIAQTALRFCLSQPAVSSVIPGMRKPAHVVQNLAASAAGPLSAEVLETLTRHRWLRNFYD